MLKKDAFPTKNLPAPQEVIDIDANELKQETDEIITIEIDPLQEMPQTLMKLTDEKLSSKTAKKCSVLSCGGIENDNKNLRFYRFPLENKKLCKIWKHKCGQPNMICTSSQYICSRHFIAADFKTSKYTFC